MSLAVHNYHDSHRCFASGYLLAASNGAGMDDDQNAVEDLNCPIQLQTSNAGPVMIHQWACMAKSWGLHAFILNEMEQLTVPIVFEESRFSSTNVAAGKIPIPSYVCPSASIGDGCLPQEPTTYRGNMGAWASTEPAPLNNGIFFRNSAVKMRDVIDGTTNTIMLGETMFGLWPDAFSCCARARDDMPNFDALWEGDNPRNQEVAPRYMNFGGWHPQVVQFSMVDGSARTVARNIDSTIYWSLLTRNGREPIAEEF